MANVLLLKLDGWILVLKRNRLMMNSNCQNCGGYFVSDERGVSIDRFVTQFFVYKSHIPIVHEFKSPRLLLLS